MSPDFLTLESSVFTIIQFSLVIFFYTFSTCRNSEDLNFADSLSRDKIDEKIESYNDLFLTDELKAEIHLPYLLEHRQDISKFEKSSLRSLTSANRLRRYLSQNEFEHRNRIHEISSTTIKHE